MVEQESHSEPLSIEDLYRVWNQLDSQGELSQELRDLFQLAVVKFTKEPPCVKENASMTIHYGEKQLWFQIGQGSCKIRVSRVNGRPDYEVTGLIGKTYLSRLCHFSQPLSQEHLTTVRNDLEELEDLGKELRQCLNYALMKFREEPQWVQSDTQIEIHADGKMMTFTSGKKRFKMKVTLSEKGPHYEIKALSQEDYVERLTSHIMPLSIESLETTQSELMAWGDGMEDLSKCLQLAQEQYGQEPACVKENAMLSVTWDSRKVRFHSGKGAYEISVTHDGVDIHYAVQDSSLEVYLDRFRTNPERAKLANMASERDHLHASGLMTAELEGLFDMAMERLSKEPADIQCYASVTVRWGIGEMTFKQELEDYLITVFSTNSGPHHLTKATTVLGYLKYLHHHPEELNDGKLLEIQDTLKSLQGLTDEWKSSLELAQRHFRHEPVSVKGNATLEIQNDGLQLQLVSGDRECHIWVLKSLGMWHYQVEVPSGEIYKERLYAQPQPLSIGHLVRVREELRRWKSLNSELELCLNRALEDLSREPVCIMENAHLEIQTSRTLNFISGEGNNKIKVCLTQDGTAVCTVETAGWWECIVRIFF